MPRGFTEGEKAHIRKRLLSVGKEAFGHYGIKKTSVEELTTNAGISKGAFYQFFDSKESLYFTIIREFETGYQQQMEQLFAGECDDEQVLFKSVFTSILEAVDNDPFFKRVLTKAEYDYLWQKFTPEQIEEAMEADIDFSTKLVEGWRAKGKLKIDNPPLITGVFRGIFTLYLHKSDIGEDVFPEVIDLLLDTTIEKFIEK